MKRYRYNDPFSFLGKFLLKSSYLWNSGSYLKILQMNVRTMDQVIADIIAVTKKDGFIYEDDQCHIGDSCPFHRF